MFCPKCGAQSETGKFCRQCGTNLSAVSQIIADPARPQVETRAKSGGGGLTLALFGPAAVSNEGRDIADHKATAVFGNVTVDLSCAPLAQGETKIGAYTLFGSIDLL